jgi:hypothetical protein
MERRIGLRARTDFGVIARDGRRKSRCRGIEVSSSGIIVDRGRAATAANDAVLIEIEIQLPERMRAIRALARPVWSRGAQLALRIVEMADVDRLTLAEHLDVLHLRGVALS